MNEVGGAVRGGAYAVLLVDDHPGLRAGLHALLAAEPTIATIREAGDAASALALARTTRFDLAVVDILLPDAGGASVIRDLQALQPTCRVLAFSSVEEPIRIKELFRAGADGYAFKTQPTHEILSAVRTVLADERYLPPALAASDVMDDVAALPLDRLTRRERVVFQHLVRGLRNQAIATELAVAMRTVDAHRRNIMRKLEARSVVDLIRIARQHGVFDPSEPH